MSGEQRDGKGSSGAGDSNQAPKGTPGLKLIDGSAVHQQNENTQETTGITLELYDSGAAPRQSDASSSDAPSSASPANVVPIKAADSSAEPGSSQGSGIEIALDLGSSDLGLNAVETSSFGSRDKGGAGDSAQASGEGSISISSIEGQSAAFQGDAAGPTGADASEEDLDSFSLEGLEIPEPDAPDGGMVGAADLKSLVSLSDEGDGSVANDHAIGKNQEKKANLADFGLPIESPPTRTLSSISDYGGRSDSLARETGIPQPPPFKGVLGDRVDEGVGGANQEAAGGPSLVGDPGVTELSYLFKKKGPGTVSRPFDPATIAQWTPHPVGDAVVPGGAASPPDVEVLKKYLMLREQDVAALSVQLQTAQEQVRNTEALLQEERANNATLHHLCEEQDGKLKDHDRVRTEGEAILKAEIEELRFQLRAKEDQVRAVEVRMREAIDETDRLKDRVRTDIRKIRIREKELESRLEMMKRDSEALMGAREIKIVELKRRLDLLEFNMDLLQNQYKKEQDHASGLKQKLSQVAQAVRVAGGLLDPTRDAQVGSFRALESLVKDLDEKASDESESRSGESSAA